MIQNSLNIFNGLNKNSCYGCCACEQICPAKCIEMVEDEEGFVFPSWSKNECSECGLCVKVCPAFKNNHPKIFHKPASHAFAAWNNNLKERMNSSSGGIFSVFAKAILDEGGAVYGCAWKEGKFEAIHIRISSIIDIPKLQGSKYVQSFTGNTFNDVKADLKKGKKVLYTGTPCQIAGLKLFLGKDFPNLFSIDLICHGTPSPLVLSKYIEMLEENYGKIKDLKFRDKKKSGYRSYISFITQDNSRISLIVGLSPFMIGFFKAYFNRESCYNCDFTSNSRVGDVTIADYWGLDQAHPELKKHEKYGISCILCNSQKGIDLISSVKNKLKLHNSSFEKCAQKQPSLHHPDLRPSYRNSIFSDLNKLGFSYLSKNFLRPRYYWFRRLIPARLKNLIRYIK